MAKRLSKEEIGRRIAEIIERDGFDDGPGFTTEDLKRILGIDEE